MKYRSYTVKKNPILKTILLLSFILILNQGVFAQTAWTGSGDGSSWSDGSNWSAGVPNGNDVTIDLASAATIVDASFTNSITSLAIGASQTCSVTLQSRRVFL